MDVDIFVGRCTGGVSAQDVGRLLAAAGLLVGQVRNHGQNYFATVRVVEAQSQQMAREVVSSRLPHIPKCVAGNPSKTVGIVELSTSGGKPNSSISGAQAPSRVLHVAGYHNKFGNELVLEGFFSSVGGVTAVVLHDSKPFCWVVMEDVASAARAIEAYNTKLVLDGVLSCQFSPSDPVELIARSVRDRPRGGHEEARPLLPPHDYGIGRRRRSESRERGRGGWEDMSHHQRDFEMYERPAGDSGRGGSHTQDEEAGHRIVFVGNLGKDVTRPVLFEAFEAQRLRPIDANLKQSFAFVTIDVSGDEGGWQNKLNRVPCELGHERRRITVELAKQQKKERRPLSRSRSRDRGQQRERRGDPPRNYDRWEGQRDGARGHSRSNS